MSRLPSGFSGAPSAGRVARRPPWPFATSDAPLWLSEVARFYGVLPSSLLLLTAEELRVNLTCYQRHQEVRQKTARKADFFPTWEI